MQEVIGSTPIFSTILYTEEEIFDILIHKTVSKTLFFKLSRFLKSQLQLIV